MQTLSILSNVFTVNYPKLRIFGELDIKMCYCYMSYHMSVLSYLKKTVLLLFGQDRFLERLNTSSFCNHAQQKKASQTRSVFPVSLARQDKEFIHHGCFFILTEF